jgi:molybdate transport system substrate-binding protein
MRPNQMKTRWFFIILAIFFFIGPAKSFAQVKVITSGGFSEPLKELLPGFEKTTGIKVTIGTGPSQGNGPNVIGAQLRRGVPADLVIMSREGLNDLIADKRIINGTDVDLARTPLGLSVRSGAPKPKIATVDEFEQALLRAKSVTFPSSTTGIYMLNKMFPLLGIAKEMAAKTTNDGVAAVAKGEAEIAIQPVSELLHAPGADFVGTIPKELQYISVSSTAIVVGSNQIQAAKQFVSWLSSEKAASAMRNSGMEPINATR